MTKKSRLNFFKNLTKNFNVIIENINENITAQKFSIVICKFLNSIIFIRLWELTATRVGIDSKKEIFAESILLNFKNLAPVIVMPDLLTPGIKDKT